MAQEQKGAANGLYRFLNRMADCIIISMVFVATCLPVVTMGTAFSALHYTVRKVIRKENGYLLKEYFGFFKRNFKQTFLLWLGFLIPGLLLGTAFTVLNTYRNAGYAFGNLFVLPGAAGLLLIAYGIQVFSYAARFEGTISETLKTAGKLAVLNILPAFACTILLIATIVAFFYVMPLIIILPAVTCLLISILMDSVYAKYMEEVEEEEEGEE